jgi:Ser/Thr protein kinase RdoA (MazF antagonist)
MVLLSEQQANDILGLAGLSGRVVVDTVKQYNHVYRLSCGDEVFFLKTYTKDWYGDDIAATGGCVAHEASAWAILAANSLATPEVVLALQGCDNPLGRPLIVTRALRGANLVEQLQQTGDLGALLETTGAYLGQMHAITFAFPGYLMNSGPIAPPREDDWQHSIWTARQWQKNALAVFQHEHGRLSHEIADQLAAALAGAEQVLAPAYTPPRYTHGDCWAHQFFLFKEEGRWHVDGVVDMEVASAGDAGSDLVHLLIELSSTLPAASRWWQAFFAGYGHVPDFELFRLRLLGASEAEFSWIWPGMHQQILLHALDARSWDSLFAHDMWLRSQ